MPSDETLFEDLLRLGAGDASVVSDRVECFSHYVETVTAAYPEDANAEWRPGTAQGL